jgi:predicted methyltransferase
VQTGEIQTLTSSTDIVQLKMLRPRGDVHGRAMWLLGEESLVGGSYNAQVLSLYGAPHPIAYDFTRVWKVHNSY